ncbi:hypothetical protein Tco_1109166 [Tanacetum coccineum]
MAPKKTPMSDAAIKALIAQGVADVLLDYEANRGSGTAQVRLVPSFFTIFDLDPLTLSLDFVLMYEIFKSLSFRLDRLCCLAILCLDQHAHTLHHLESLLIISLDRLDILKEDLFEHEHMVVNPTPAGMRHHHLHLYMKPEIKQLAIKRMDEYGFVIRLDLVRLTSSSVGPFYSINRCIRFTVLTSSQYQNVSKQTTRYE